MNQILIMHQLLYSVNVNANIPGEGIITKQVNFSPKNVEKNENLVLKFASGFNNVEHSASGKDPFTARATRNVSGSGGINNVVVTETTLSKEKRKAVII